ncbi:MAG: hypothetical protein DRQ88_00060 [Epsilonproteobacteria bacterium]|nr:MAG: hypothetical protein DRQ89_10695 [Campylobacterota bacterium]RLA68030.1 MAG: hypothetical protein DRQ88_00060 [Campylobacterota bacterium]
MKKNIFKLIIITAFLILPIKVFSGTNTFPSSFNTKKVQILLLNDFIELMRKPSNKSYYRIKVIDVNLKVLDNGLNIYDGKIYFNTPECENRTFKKEWISSACENDYCMAIWSELNECSVKDGS